jgi:hypothetical protein
MGSCCGSPRRKAQALPNYALSVQIPEVPPGGLDLLDSPGEADLGAYSLAPPPTGPQADAIPKVRGPTDEELIARMLAQVDEGSD